MISASQFFKSVCILLSVLNYAAGQTLSPAAVNSQEESYSITQRVILIGDAGDPAKDFKEPVLIALEREASKLPDSTLVIFLGDNIYSNGLPDENDPDRKEYEWKIDQQIAAVLTSGASGIFIPGNHDWKQGDDDGWQRIINQSEYILNAGQNKISFSPLKGCPGPVVFDFTDRIRIITLDSQWWLQDNGKRPEIQDSICQLCTGQAVAAALDSILSLSKDKSVIIAAHHPLTTHGSHGGYFNWEDHIFPLRHINNFLWLPLPVIGSLYPFLRGNGISSQDLSSSVYQNYKNKIESVLMKYSYLVFASGHEHALQILDGGNNNTYVVSGAGIWGHAQGSITEGDDTIFKVGHEGFVTLDYLENGRIMLSVVKVLNEAGDSQPVFSMQIYSGS